MAGTLNSELTAPRDLALADFGEEFQTSAGDTFDAVLVPAAGRTDEGAPAGVDRRERAELHVAEGAVVLTRDMVIIRLADDSEWGVADVAPAQFGTVVAELEQRTRTKVGRL